VNLGTGLTMDMNGSDHANITSPRQLSPNGNGLTYPKSPPPDEQHELREELRQLRLQLERLRDQQTALLHTPQPKKTNVADEAENEQTGRSDPKGRPNSDNVHHRRLLRLTAALLGAALLCVPSMRLWNHVQSYEWTDDAEIEGHPDPINSNQRYRCGGVRREYLPRQKGLAPG
jgi:hypothetical protein